MPGGEILFSGRRVRKIGLDGRLSVVAGTGYITNVPPRDNAPATATSWVALGLERDLQGNLYYATYGNVVQVDPQGILRRVAGTEDGLCGLSGDGGPAREAQLCQPWDVAVDRDGNIWVADSRADEATHKGSVVVKFAPDGRVLMTLGKAGVSGSGPDLFDQPTDVVTAPARGIPPAVCT